MRRFAQDGMRDRGIVGERLAFGISPDGQHQLSFVAALKKYVAALRTRQIQRSLDKRDQHFFQYAAGVELARRFQEKCQSVQFGDGAWCLRRLPSLYLA